MKRIATRLRGTIDEPTYTHEFTLGTRQDHEVQARAEAGRPGSR